MHFCFVTLFPNLIQPYFEDSILKRSLENGCFTISYTNPRDYTTNKHFKVDDTAYSGGAGMLMNAQPLCDALKSVKCEYKEAHIIFAAPAGKPFTQQDAKRLSKKKSLVFVSGRYEGIDERVVELYGDEVFSIGDYVLTGGELPSLVMCDAIARNVKGVLGNDASLSEESFETTLLEAPSFTKPALFEKKGVPSEYLKGNHAKIAHLKFALAECKTKYFRPDRFVKQKSRSNYEK